MKVTLRHSLSLASILVATLSCGKANESSSVNSFTADAFLSATDLSKGSKVNTTAKADLDAELSDVSDFYDNEPSGLARFMAESCVTSLLNKIPAKSYGSYVGVGAEIDITSCLDELFGDPDFKGAPSSLRIAFQAGCDNQDFSTFDGKTFGEITATDESSCANSTTVSDLVNMKMSIGATTTTSGQNIALQMLSYNATATADLKPCSGTVSNGAIHKGDGCLLTARSIKSIYKLNGTSLPEEGSEDFRQLETSSIVAAAGSNTWFQSGKMKTTLNNWAGDVTYSGTSTAPTYSLTNGTETATGSLSVARSTGRVGTIAKIAQTATDNMVKAAKSVKQAARSL